MMQIHECDVVALQCQTPSRSLQLFLSRVQTALQRNYVTFQDGGLQEI